MKHYDVFIVGGGPAGSSLAYTLNSLTDGGLRIAILDKADFPRQKVCAGWVTPEVMRLLDVDLEDYSGSRVLQKISGFHVGMLGQKMVESDYSGKPVSYGIRRYEFDDYLLKRCGAELILGESLKTLERNGSAEDYIVNNRYSASLVVGAGGHYCPVARATGTKGISEQAVVAQEVEFEMDENQRSQCLVNENKPELFFTPDLMGYGWVFRKGNYLNIGLGREDKSRLSSHVKKFCAQLAEAGRIPGAITDKFNGHAYLLYTHARRELVKDGVILIGDSAGLAYPQSGEGIRPAVESALLAAKVILKCNGRYTDANLKRYAAMMEARFGKRQHQDLIEKIPMGLKRPVAALLMKTGWFTRNIVTEHWFLQKQQAPLPAVSEMQHVQVS
jgi:geranylgeranyl reductase family protein